MNWIFNFRTLFIVFFLVQCNSLNDRDQNPFPNTVFYQFYTRAFYDSDSDRLRLDAARHIYDIESLMIMDSSKRNFTWWKTFYDEMKYPLNYRRFLL